MPSLAPIEELPGVAADAVACGPGDAWAAAGRRTLLLPGGAVDTPPRPLTGALRFTAAGEAVLAGCERFDLAAARWAELADPRPAIAGGTGELELSAAAWDGAGELLVLAAALLPPRTRSGAPTPPRAWLTLIDGRNRSPVRALWDGNVPGPRAIGFEGGVIAADPGRRARVWRGEEEVAVGEDTVAGLALGDGGALLAVAGSDGRLALWRGPGFDAPDVVGDGAAGAVAVAAAAPVVAWATADAVVVHAGGGRAELAGTARALALDAAGERLAVLTADAALRRYAIAD